MKYIKPSIEVIEIAPSFILAGSYKETHKSSDGNGCGNCDSWAMFGGCNNCGSGCTCTKFNSTTSDPNCHHSKSSRLLWEE